MPKLTKAERFLKLIDQGWDRKLALRRVGYRPGSAHSADSLASALIARKERRPRGFDKLRPCLQQVWLNLSDTDKSNIEFWIDNPKENGTLAENLLSFLPPPYAPSTAPKPVPPPVATIRCRVCGSDHPPDRCPIPKQPPAPEPESFLPKGFTQEDITAIHRAQAWQNQILYGGRNMDEPAPPPGENDGLWSQATGFRSFDQIAQEEAAAEAARRPRFIQTDNPRSLRRR